MKARYYQTEAINAIVNEWNSGIDKTLLILPTGTGKTFVFSKIAQLAVRSGGRVLILAHREELIKQAQDKLYVATGIKSSIEKAEQTCIGKPWRVVCGSVQTMQSEKRLLKFSPRHFTHIIIDESHHSVSKSYQKILAYFTNAKILGVTATADRGDRVNLGDYYQTLAYEYTLFQAIREGFLCPIEAIQIPLKIDMKGIKTTCGDLSVAEVGSRLMPYLDAIAEQMKIHCVNEKTIIFCPLVATAQKMQQILISHGFRAGEINAKTENRAEVLAKFSSGEYNVLLNSMLLTEGYDEPSITCVINLRATKVRSLFVQMVGRGTRLLFDALGRQLPKTLKILDFLFDTEKHDLCKSIHLVQKNRSLANEIAKIQDEQTDKEDKPRVINLSGLDDEVNKDEIKALEIIKQREDSVAEKINASAYKGMKLVDPVKLGIEINGLKYNDAVADTASRSLSVSDKQKDTLVDLGVNPAFTKNAAHASNQIEVLMNRRKSKMSTLRQIKQLKQKGFKNSENWTGDQAKQIMNRLAVNGWRVPPDICPSSYIP
jgi:superfamily II DNA or RNA helicase